MLVGLLNLRVSTACRRVICCLWPTLRCTPASPSWPLPVMTRPGSCGTCQQGTSSCVERGTGKQQLLGVKQAWGSASCAQEPTVLQQLTLAAG